MSKRLMKTYFGIFVRRSFDSCRSNKNATHNIVRNATTLKPFDAIPGPKRIPLFGHLYLFGRFGPYTFEKLYDAYQDLHEKYGDIIRLELGISMVALFNPEDVQKLWQTEDLYPRRPIFEALKQHRTKNRHRYGSGGLVAENGAEWRRLRRAVNFILKPQFVYQNYHDAHDEVARDFVERIRRIRNSDALVKDLLKELYRYTEEAIGVACFGTRLGLFDDNDEEARLRSERLTQAADDTLEAMADTLLGFPWWKVIETPTYKKLIESQDFFMDFASQRLAEAMNKIRSSGDSDQQSTLQFLRVLSQQDGLQESDIRLLMMEIFSAGIDATGNALGYLLYNLAANPSVQDRLYEEISNVCGEGISSASYSRLRYLHACIKESYRLTPTAGGFARILGRPTDFSGFQVPKDVLCIGINPVISRQERYFKDPLCFQPERWLQTDLPAHPHCVLPFGLGARRCVGQRFAEQEIRLLIIRLIQNFRVNYDGPPLRTKMRMMLTPDHPLDFEFVDRQ